MADTPVVPAAATDPWISVLIPAYNRAGTIRACVASVLASGYAQLEIIVSDNGSTDGTADIVAEMQSADGRIQLIRHARNLGPLPNWRSCLDAARHPLVHWLWSDDWVEPGFYRRLVDGMRRDQAQMAVGAARIWQEDTGRQRIMYSLFDEPRTGREFIRIALDGFRSPVSPAAALLPTAAVRRHFTDAIPRFLGIDCNKRAIGCDAVMILGSAWESERVYYCPDPLVVFRSHKDSITIGSGRKLVQAHYAWARLMWCRKRGIPLRWRLWDLARLCWRFLPV